MGDDLYLDKNRKIMPTILLIYLVFLLVGAGIIHFTCKDKVYQRKVGDDVLDFDAMVWRDYFLEGSFLAIIAILLTRKYACPLLPGVIGMAAWILHYLGGAMDWYHHYEWWDHLTHGLAHVVFVFFFLYMYEVGTDRGLVKIRPYIAMILVVILSMGMGAFSETREYAFSIFFDTIDQGGYHNTMQDFVWDFIGGSLAMYYYVLRNSYFGGSQSGGAETKKRFRGKEVAPLIYVLVGITVLNYFLFISWVEKVEKFNQLWAEFIGPGMGLVRCYLGF